MSEVFSFECRNIEVEALSSLSSLISESTVTSEILDDTAINISAFTIDADIKKNEDVKSKLKVFMLMIVAYTVYNL